MANEIMFMTGMLFMFMAAILHLNNIFLYSMCGDALPLLYQLKFLKLKEDEYVVFDDYFELVPLMNETQFMEDFRMPSSHFVMLYEKLATTEAFTCTSHGKPPINSEKCLCIGLWVLATPDSYRSISRRFAVSKATVKTCVNRVIKGLLSDIIQTAIRLPRTENDRRTLAQEFHDIARMENVIGALDGCQIKIRAPARRNDKKVFINRKKDCAVNLFAVCDANLFFTNVDLRWPGSVHDARAFMTSDLYPICSNICVNGYYFIGDSAYPLKTYLMRPYRRTYRLNNRQRLFNKILSKTRQVIERAFGLLKNVFRRLYYLQLNDVDDIVHTIVACCVLHNICLASEEYARILIFGENAANPVPNHNQAQQNNIIDPNAKRQHIMNRIWDIYTQEERAELLD